MCLDCPLRSELEIGSLTGYSRTHESRLWLEALCSGLLRRIGLVCVFRLRRCDVRRELGGGGARVARAIRAVGHAGQRTWIHQSGP